MSKYDIVLEKIIRKLKEGTIPWRQTWKFGKIPANYVTKKAYRGINLLLLMGNPYTSPYYLTFRQIKERKGYIKTGEKGHIVVYYKPIDPDEEDKYFVLRYYRIWNIQQTSLQVEETDLSEEQQIPKCQEVIDNMPNEPNIEEGLFAPCYLPIKDKILMPVLSDFQSSEEYYAILFHELVHSTGNEKRLNRFPSDTSSKFGSESYSEEELVAEIGASFLCSFTSILPRTLDNNVAYISSWLKAIQDNKKILFRAASNAQKAIDYIVTDGGNS